MGMDTVLLHAMTRKIEFSMNYVDAFLIVKDGYLVYEHYFNGYDKDTPHLICSATKSVTNIVMGIMFTNNFITDIGLNILEYFPEYREINSDVRINDITLEHIMAYTAGLYNSDSEAYGSASTDALKYYLGNRFLSDPGVEFRYATPASHLQSALITKILGVSEQTFAEQKLLSNLGINNFNWLTDPLGYTYGGHNAYFCPRDMLKFGYLYLNQGVWNGDTLVDPGFVAASTMVHTNGGSPHNEKYGYNWWITKNNGYDAYFAGGYGGQFIYVVPELDLVVAITCNTVSHRETARFLINTHVVPSILQPASSEIKTTKNRTRAVRIAPDWIQNQWLISFQIDKKETVYFSLTDLYGKNLGSCSEKRAYEAGIHCLTINVVPVPGPYILRGFIGETEVICKKMINPVMGYNPNP